MNLQQLASILRQVAAVGAIVMGALTATLNGIHLPPAVSAVLTALGGGLLWIEHYVGDPSTGTTNAPVAVPSLPTVTFGLSQTSGGSPPPTTGNVVPPPLPATVAAAAADAEAKTAVAQAAIDHLNQLKAAASSTSS